MTHIEEIYAKYSVHPQVLGSRIFKIDPNGGGIIQVWGHSLAHLASLPAFIGFDISIQKFTSPLEYNHANLYDRG